MRSSLAAIALLVFAAAAASGAVRVDDHGALGDGVTWDHDAIQSAVDAAGEDGTVLFTAGRTYVICRPIQYLPGQIFSGYGATLRRCDSVQSPLAADAPAGARVVEVADGSVFRPGMFITPISGPSMPEGEGPFPHRNRPVLSIDGNFLHFANGLGQGYSQGDLVITIFAMLRWSDFLAGRIQVEGLTFDGNRRGNPDYIAWQLGPTIEHEQGNLVVRDARFVDTWGDAIKSTGSQHLVADSLFDGAGGAGLHLSTTRNLTIERSVFRNLTLEASLAYHSEAAVTWSLWNDGIDVRDSCFGDLPHGALGFMRFEKNRNITIENNRACGVEYFFSGGIYGTPLYTPTGQLKVRNNVIVDAGTSRIQGLPAYPATIRGVEILGNLFVRSDMSLDEALLVAPVVSGNLTMQTGDCSCTMACNDGLDNDGDGRIDYPEDPSCRSLLSPSEAVCGLGFEIAPVLAGLLALRRSRARRTGRA